MNAMRHGERSAEAIEARAMRAGLLRRLREHETERRKAAACVETQDHAD